MPANTARGPEPNEDRSGGRRPQPTDPLSTFLEAPELLRRTLMRLPGMVYRRRVDERWTLEFASPGCRAVTGFAATDLVRAEGTSFLDLVHPDDRATALSEVRDAVAERGTFQAFYRIRRVDGQERRVLDQGYVTLADDGRAIVEGIVTDVTGRSREAGLRSEQQARFEALLEQSLAGIYAIRDDRFTYVNARFAEIFGYAVEQIVRLPSVLELVHPEDRGTVATSIRRRIEGSSSDARYEFRGLTRAGSTVDVEVHGRRVELDGHPCVLGILLDVSERKRVERAAREAEKLEALRRLAAGVAHDLNNFLSTIRTTAELLQLEHTGDDQLGEDLRSIVEAVDDGTGLSAQLTRFARRKDEFASTDDPSRVLSDLVASLRPLLGRRIEVRTELPPELPPVAVSPEDLEEIVTNLALDAQDAMRDGGTLALTACPGPADATLSEAGGAASLVLEMTDSGTRVPPTDGEHAFEPYYPTAGARSLGLRLAIVSRIVRDAGGTVTMTASKPAETTVRVVLPGVRPDGSRSEP